MTILRFLHNIGFTNLTDEQVDRYDLKVKEAGLNTKWQEGKAMFRYIFFNEKYIKKDKKDNKDDNKGL